MEEKGKTETRPVPSTELKGSSRCRLKRSRNLSMKDDKGVANVYEKAVLIKDMIRKGLFKVLTDEEIEANLEYEFRNSLEFATGETAALQAADAYRQVMRYVHSEKRDPEPARADVVRPFDLFDVRVKPDYIFTGKKDFEYEAYDGRKKIKYPKVKNYIEVVRIRCCKPDVTDGGRTRDACKERCLELYAMLLYARKTAERSGFKDGVVCASYYYLRKNNDNSASKYFDPRFFENAGAGNVVSLWEDYQPGKRTELDLLFEPQFEEFAEGSPCEESSCEHCEYDEVCNYTKPPEKAEKESFTGTPSGEVKLTGTQKAVVDFREGVACVNAGAGAGKTTSIALRAANIIKETGRPEGICMLTFTNAGAEEMTSRIREYVKEAGTEADMDRLTSTTFNAFGYSIVKENYKELGFSEPPLLIDEVERSRMIAGIIKETIVPDLNYRDFYSNNRYTRGALSVAKKVFETIKRDDITDLDPLKIYNALPNGYTQLSLNGSLPVLTKLYKEYNEKLQKGNLLEYADQELLLFEILKKHPDYFDRFHYEHIIVDEFQDTNELQFELLKKLIDTPSFKSFMVVGDDSQSVFAFRGSDPQFIINFFDKLGMRGRKFDMVENHRSTDEIVDFANRINGYNRNKVDKLLIPVKGHGASVNVKVFWKKNEDMEYALETVEKEHGAGTAYEDIAYIGYTRYELMKMGDLLSQAGIPWVMLSPEPVLENSRVIGALSLAKFICDPEATKHAVIYLNAARNGGILDGEDDEAIKAGVSKLNDRIEAMLDEEDDEAKRKNLLALLGELEHDDEIFKRFFETVQEKRTFDEMLDYCVYYETYGEGQAARRMESYPGVALTTAHSSKGREWPVVINNLSGYHTKDVSNRFSAEFEEKRRLLFVSATRAKERLYITGQAVAYGNKREHTRTLNEFLLESCSVTGTEFPDEPKPERKARKSA